MRELLLGSALLLKRGDGFDGAFVHPLRTDPAPVFFKFVGSHGFVDGALFGLQPLFGPVAKIGIAVERRTRGVGVDGGTHSSHSVFMIIYHVNQFEKWEIPLLSQEGWREAPGWFQRANLQNGSNGNHPSR